MLDAAGLRDFLTELEQFGEANDQRETDRSKKMLNLEPETARLVSILIRTRRPKLVLEIGTSNGYSTIWLAIAVSGSSGRVISIERNPAKQAMAEENLKRAGVLDCVDLRLGDATDVVAQLEGPFDCVFFDADRTSAPEQLKLLLPKLSDGALILADNALSHPQEIAGYLDAIGKVADFEHAVVPVGKGLSIAIHKGSALAVPPI